VRFKRGRLTGGGLGLAARGPYRVSTLTGPDRVVIDVSHVPSK
jgi:hypothetical protein